MCLALAFILFAQIYFQDWLKVPSEEFGTPDAPSLGFDNTLFPFLSMAWLILAASIVALTEWIYSHWFQRVILN